MRNTHGVADQPNSGVGIHVGYVVVQVLSMSLIIGTPGLVDSPCQPLRKHSPQRGRPPDKSARICSLRRNSRTQSSKKNRLSHSSRRTTGCPVDQLDLCPVTHVEFVILRCRTTHSKHTRRCPFDSDDDSFILLVRKLLSAECHPLDRLAYHMAPQPIRIGFPAEFYA